MPSAMRVVRSGVLLLMFALSMPVFAGNQVTSVSAIPHGAPAATNSGGSADERPHAAIMDLWLATSLSLILLYVRRRRRARH